MIKDTDTDASVQHYADHLAEQETQAKLRAIVWMFDTVSLERPTTERLEARARSAGFDDHTIGWVQGFYRNYPAFYDGRWELVGRDFMAESHTHG